MYSSELPPKRCRCHLDSLYNGLTACPACGHWSLDKGDWWEGCERRSCGYEKVTDPAKAEEARKKWAA